MACPPSRVSSQTRGREGEAEGGGSIKSFCFASSDRRSGGDISSRLSWSRSPPCASAPCHHTDCARLRCGKHTPGLCARSGIACTLHNHNLQESTTSKSSNHCRETSHQSSIRAELEAEGQRARFQWPRVIRGSHTPGTMAVRPSVAAGSATRRVPKGLILLPGASWSRRERAPPCDPAPLQGQARAEGIGQGGPRCRRLRTGERALVEIAAPRLSKTRRSAEALTRVCAPRRGVRDCTPCRDHRAVLLRVDAEARVCARRPRRAQAGSRGQQLEVPREDELASQQRRQVVEAKAGGRQARQRGSAAQHGRRGGTDAAAPDAAANTNTSRALDPRPCRHRPGRWRSGSRAEGRGRRRASATGRCSSADAAGWVRRLGAWACLWPRQAWVRPDGMDAHTGAGVHPTPTSAAQRSRGVARRQRAHGTAQHATGRHATDARCIVRPSNATPVLVPARLRAMA